MLCEISASSPTDTIATLQARQNLAANRLALRLSSAFLSIPDELEAHDWVYARDGSLTRRADGNWLGNCSVPLLAGREMVKSLAAKGAVICLLDPPHAQTIVAAFERLTPLQTVIVIKTDATDLMSLLACADLGNLITARRLHWIAGDAWPGQLHQLLADNPGLPVPSQFVRVSATEDSVVQGIIQIARPIIIEAGKRRAQRTLALLSKARPNTRKVAVLTQSHFRLWDDAGAILGMTLQSASQFQTQFLDQDHPLTACTTALAICAAESDAIVTANAARADLPGLVGTDRPWICWVTGGRIPARDPHAPADGLLLADPAWREPALRAGWPANRIRITGWPMRAGQHSTEKISSLALICNTSSLDVPEDELPYSSHHVLWQTIARELLETPDSLTANLDAFLSDRLARYRISEEGFDRRLFIERLLLPAYAHGLAGTLVRGGIPLNLYGKGWQDLPAFAPHAREPVESGEALIDIARCHKALVHCWPSHTAHPIDSLGVPVVRAGKNRSLIAPFREAIANPSNPVQRVVPSLSADLINELLD